MGKAKIQEGSFRIIHVTEIGVLEQIIDEVKFTVETHITKSHPLYPYLNHETSQLQEYLNEIKPIRKKRSLNFLGSTWKWIAGTPDHDDFVMIKKKVNNLLENSNKQVVINNLYNNRLNNITKITNAILESIRTNNIIDNQAIFKLQYKIKLLKEEIINIKYSIHWAKLGMINSFLVSKVEVETITKLLDSEQLPYATAEEALDFANIKIITNGTSLLYVIEIPLTKLETYNRLLIKPIKFKNIINEIEFKEILSDNKKLYGIKENCNKINDLTICKRKDIVDIENSTCIKNLFKSKNSICNTINNHHIPTIEEIQQGIILLNQFSGEIIIGNEVRNMTGTYLIKFHNTTISIMGNTFTSKEIVTTEILPPILQPKSIQGDFREHLSLEFLKEVHINNTKEIELLQAEKSFNEAISYGSSTTVIIVVIIIIINTILKKRRSVTIKNITNKQNTQQNTASPQEQKQPQIILKLTSNEDI